MELAKNILWDKQVQQRTWLIGTPILLSIILLLVSFYSFLLFHTLAELFAIIIALIMSVVAWQMYPYTRNDYLMFLGCGYFWIGVLDLLHTLTYKGMHVIPAAEPSNTAIQFWIVTRFLEAFILLIAPFFLDRKLARNFASFSFGVIACLLTVWVMSGVFPDMFIEGEGLTPQKVNSEYIINLIIAAAIYFLWRRREWLDPRIFRLIIISMILTMAAELAFTFYVSLYGLSNLVGHIFKIFSFWLIYVAVVKTTLRDPFSALSRSASTYDAIPEAVLAIDKEGIIHQANHAASKLAGLPTMVLLDKDSHTLFHPSSLQKADCPVCNAVKQGIYIDNIQLFWPERSAWLDFSIAPMQTDTGVQAGMVETIREVTKQREAQEELHEHREHLQELVKERTSTLELAYEDLKIARDEAIRATNIKSEFLANMSHELRTPLNSIIGFTGVVKDGIAGDLNEEQKKQLNIAYESAQHLLTLINDILDISKIEAGEIEIIKDEFDCIALLEESLKIIEPLSKQKGLKLEMISEHDTLNIYSDRGKVKQAILNLLSNAVKFTDQGSVTLTCSTNDNKLYISVSDTGEGIDQQDFKKIFQTFKQIDGSNVRIHQGTGLGLAISQKFMEMLGGSISVQSTVGEGSTFTVCLPLSEVKQ